MNPPFASLATLLFCASEVAAQKPGVSDTIDRFIGAELRRQRIPGMAVAVLRGDSLLLSRGYGVANVEQRLPATDSTLFTVGSVTKPFDFSATFPKPRRELLAGLLKDIHTWTPLGCDKVSGRGISRLRSRIEHICYAKGTAKQGSLLFTVLYDSGWRAAGLDNVFGI